MIELLCAAALAMTDPPRIGDQVRVNQILTSGQNETTAAASDEAPARIIHGWNDYRNDIRSWFALSTDFGSTWTELLVRPPSGFTSSVEGDPMTAADDRDGTLWAGAISFAGNGGLYLARMEPGATTFNPPVMMATNANSPSGFIDKGWMAAGPSTISPDLTMLYCAYNDGLIRSSNRGDSWTNPISLGSGLGFLPRVASDGTLYILYWDGNDRIRLRRSFNDGASVSAPITVAVRMDVWGIDGSRFPGSFRVPSLAYLAVDANDPDTLYVVYFDTTRIVGGNRDVDLYFTMSTDQGDNWTTPSIINDTTNASADSWFPWIEADDNGRLHVVFHDNRNVVQNDSDSIAWIDAYYAWSDDQGATWTESRLTESPFNSEQDGRGGGGSFLGDYHGMAMAGPLLYPSYLSNQDGTSDVFTHLINNCPADFATPWAELDIFDVLAYLDLFEDEDPAADLASPEGVFDIFDILAFMQALSEGC